MASASGTKKSGDSVLTSDDVDHQKTTNRTHEGDNIAPESLEAGGWSFIGEFQTLSDFDSEASSGDKGYITESQQFARQP